MNEFSFSENSLAGVPAEGLREEAFSPRLQLEDVGRVTGLEPYGEISHQSFKTMDMVEPPPPVGSGLDFKEALAVYDTLEDGPARVALSNELDKWERRQALENYGSPLGERERREYQQKVERLDALGMDWKAHPEARKKAAEAYGEEWVRAFEAVPDEHKSRVRGEKVLEEFYSRPGDRDGDSMIRYLSSVDAPEGIRGSRDVWDRWNAGRQPFFKAQEKEAEAGRSFAAKAVPVIRAMMNGEGFLEALGKVELTPEEENFAMLHCGYGTPWGQAVQHAADWLRGRGFDLQPEAAVERRAKELADAYVKERERYVSRNDASLSWGGLPNPFSRTMDDFRQEARDEMTGNITDANVFDFARALLDLKTEDPMAAEAVIGLYKADAERLRNDSTLFVSPFNRTMRMMMESSSSLFEQLLLGDVREGDTVEWQPTGESFAPVVRDSEGKQVYRVLTPDQNEMISQIRAMKAEIAESPDGAWWIRRQFDGLGRMAAQTSFFLATRGMGTFASVANDRMEELRAQGVSPLESLIRGGIAGGTEVLVERLGGESLFKTLRFLGGKMPFAGKFAGYMGSAADMMKRGLYGNAALRYGVASLAAGGSEWMEEFIQPTLQAPLDAGLARLFGSGNGMTVEDWKEMLRGAADPDLGFQMLMFGAVVGGAQIPAFAREAQVSRVGAPQIEGLGVGRAEAERIASIVDPVEKSREIFQAALSMSDRAAQLESVRQGFSAMKEDFSWLARQEAYQAEVELLNLPRVEDLGDGSWRFTTTVRDAEGQESYDVLELSEQDATARMQALLHDGIRLRMLEAQQAFAVDRTIDQLSQSGKYVFEDMGRAETVETARKLAEAARLRIAEGADVNAEAQDLGTRMTYGQAAGMGSSFEERVKLGVARGEVSASRRVHSNAYRVAMRNGQTLIRFHKGEVTVPELLEEVLETHLTEDMENTKHSLDWYANNLRALQDALRKEGYLSKGKDLIRKDGEVSVKDVVEGMSMLAKGDVLARAADMRLPQWMKDFLQMVRQWVSSAKALLDLGTGLHEMERRRLAGESVPIDADFAQMVHALSNSLESYWMQEGARQGEADVQRIVEEVGGSGVSMSLAEDSSVSFSLVSIPSGEVITTAAEMRARLKPLQGKVFVNKNTGIQAVIEARVSAKTKGKAGASQMSVANLKRFGISIEDARTIHYTAAARIHELFENAEDALFEESYKDDPSRAGAYHFFNTVEVEGFGRFDVNVTAIAPENKERINTLYTIELTIENPRITSEEVPLSHGGVSSDTSGVSTRNLSSYRSFVEKEKAAVRKKAVADGTFMKAPNGANTNLTEDQWLSVRTAAFKNWFGDWEKDPQNASKVVDENGEPRVVYHGTYGDFTVFDKAKIVSATDYGIWGRGFYFTNMENTPYGNKKLALFLNIRNPFIFNDYKSAEEIGDYLNIWDGNFHEDDRFGIFRPYATGAAQIADSAQERGHDGLIAVLGKWTEYIAFEPNQIKSATDNRGTFDPKNPDITFSVIGPNAATWGKYADKAFAGRDDGKLRAEIDASQAQLNNDIKITAFADESTWGAWADYEDPTATFSLSEGFPRRVSRGTQNLEVVHRIAADLRADAATWGRYDGKTDEAAFLVNVGRNVALVKSALMHLPAGYRVAVKPYIDRLQILAELAAKGKIDETRMVNAFARREIKREMAEATREGMEEAEITARVTAAGTTWEKGKKPTQKFAKEVFEDEMEKVRKAWAEKRLHELMAEVMEKAAGKLEALAKDGVSAGMARMLDQVLTIRKKNGKQQKGKVSMEAYAYLTDQVVPLLRMTAMEKEAAMNEAAAELDKLEKENPDQMDGEAVSRMEELREELTRLALYGNLEGMSVDEAQAAAKALEIYINTEKEGWAAVQEAAAERLNAIGRMIVERFNQTGKKADENTLRAANEKFHGKVSFKNFGDFMENMDQLLTRMGTMPALQEFTTDMRSRLTNAFQQMRDARGLRAAAVQDLYEKHLTEKVMKARKVGNMAGWVTWFKTSHDTKVRLNGWITQTARLTLEQAREVREMDARQRKEFIRKRWEEGMEYFSEETLDLLLARLREHEEAAARARAEGRRPVYRKYVTAKASFKGEEGSPLVLSRDNALYLVLQSEQEDYREMMKQQGYTPEVISALREYVGEEGMAIGYGLRELLKAQGDKIGKLYEQVTGVPFPRVENYFPARFWALDAMSDADAADMISGVPSTKGGNQGWQRVRTKHHRRLDTSVGALSVFWEATDMTDHWYYTQDITADFRGLLRRREVAESMVANLGKDDFVRLRRWVDLLERAGVVQGQAVGSLDKLLNAVYSGQAKAILAFRFETLMKQGSAVLNAWIGDPSIGFWDYLGTMAKMRNGTAEMGVIKMMKSAEFQARLNDRVDVETLSRLRDDSSYTLAEAALVWGMNGIEYTDVFFNAVGSAALWNIKYRQAVKAGVEEGRAKDEAWQAVRNALHSAQPQTWIDKSFGGLHRGAWGRAIFYMMSENYNKTAAIYGLARAGFAPGVTPKQRWASLSKAGKVWLAYGAFNAIIGAMLDYMKDDEEEWEKRDWQGYLFAALAGPIAGMPLVGEAVEWLFSELLGAKVYTGSAGRALIDFRSGWNAAWKLGEMMQEGGHEAGDYMKQVTRLGRVFGAAGGIASGMANKTIQTAGQYMTLGAALMNPVKTVADVID